MKNNLCAHKVIELGECQSVANLEKFNPVARDDGKIWVVVVRSVGQYAYNVTGNQEEYNRLYEIFNSDEYKNQYRNSTFHLYLAPKDTPVHYMHKR